MKKKGIGFSLLTILILVFFTTCEVGLGEAVDTAAPTVTITTPSAASVIAGSIVMRGVCNDDKGVKSVNVTIKNITTGAVKTIAATVTDSKTWEDVIDTKDLPDGKYTADAEVTDLSGRKGYHNTAFDIDNTAPFFCVTSPATLNIDSPERYGRSVKISGEIADDHDIKQMDVRVFKTDDSGTQQIDGKNVVEITGCMAQTSFTDFETAGGTTVYIAKYFDAVPEEKNTDGSENADYKLYENYLAIYGDSGTTDVNAKNGGDVFVYIVPTLTDTAGNTSSSCYLSSGTKSLIAKVCGVETSVDSLQTAQLMKIYNGTYSLGQLTADQTAAAKSILDGTYAGSVSSPYYSQYVEGDTTRQRPLAASVNTKNNPTYSFEGFALDMATLPGSWQSATTGGTVTLSVAAGLDGWGVLPNTLTVNLYSCTDVAAGKTPVASSKGDDAKIIIKNASGTSVSDISTSTDKQSYYVTLPALGGGNHYLIEATGKDENSADICPVTSDGYGFSVASSESAPSVTFEDLFYINGAAIGASGDYEAVLKIVDETDKIMSGEKSKDGEKCGITVKASIYKEHISSRGYITAAGDPWKECEISGTLKKVGDNNYSFTVPFKNNEEFNLEKGNNYSIVLTVDAINTVGKSAGTTFLFWADYKAPEIIVKAPADGKLITEDYPGFDKTEIEDSNGNVSYVYKYTSNGTWSDKDGAGTDRLWCSTEGDTSPSVTFSKATNPYVSGNAYYEKQAGNCYRLVDSDKWNFGTDVSAYWTAAISDPSWKEVGDLTQAQGSSPWEQIVEITEGMENKVRFVAMDIVGNLSEVAEIGGLTYDLGLPTVKVTTPIKDPETDSKTIYYNLDDYENSGVTDQKFTFKVEAEDSLGFDAKDKLNVVATRGVEKISSAADGPYTLERELSGDKNITATIKLDATGKGDGAWSFTLSATDKAGRKTKNDLTFGFTVDCTKPEKVEHSSGKNIALKDDKSGSVADWYSTDTITVWGKYKEETSGLDTVYYYLDYSGRNEDKKNLTNLSANNDGFITVGGTTGSEIEYKITPSKFTQNEEIDSVMLYIQAKDKAGNLSSCEPYEVKVDTTAPELAAAYYNYEGDALGDIVRTIMSNGKKDMTVYGTVSDKLSGVAELKWTIGTKTVELETWFTTAALSSADTYTKEGIWKKIENVDKDKITGWKAVVKQENLKEDADVYVCACDRSGKETKKTIFVIDSDSDSPKITLNTPSTKMVAYSAEVNGTTDTKIPEETPGGITIPTEAKKVNGEVSLNGSVTDDSLKEVAIYYSDDSTATIKENDKLIEEITDSTMYNWTISKEFSYVSEGKFLFMGGSEYTGSPENLYIKIEATDQAANKTIQVYEYSVDPDSDRPVITISELDLSSMTSKDEKYVWRKNTSIIRGKVTDDDGLDGLTVEYKDNGGEFQPLTLTGGSFEIFTDESKDYDGSHILTFKVKDSKNTEFTASDSNTLSFLKPKIYKDNMPTYFGDKENDDTLVYIKVDTKNPSIRDKKYSLWNSALETPAYERAETLKAGGKLTKLKIDFYAHDTSGIGSVKFTLNGKEYDGTVDISNPDADGYWPVTIEDIKTDSTAIESGTYTGTVSIEDKAGMKSVDTIDIEIDNTSPVVTKISPSTSQTVSGSITPYGTVDGAAMYYALSTSDAEKDDEYVAIAGTSQLWYLYFDGAESTETETHGKTLNQFIIEKGVTKVNMAGKSVKATAESIASTDSETRFDSIVTLYLWIKAVDAVGNETVEKYPILLDPQGSRPEISFIYPEKNDEVMGGEIKLYGGAKAKDTNNPAIKAVFAQLVSDQHSYTEGENRTDSVSSDFVMTKEDWNYLQSAGYEIYKMEGYPDTKVMWNSANSDDDAPKYGILCEVKGSTWSIKVNGKKPTDSELGELDPKSGTNNAAIRVFASDGKNISMPETREFVVDADSPVLSSVYIENGDKSVSQEYTEGMYVQGERYLTFTLTDGQGLGVIKMGKGSTAQEAQTVNVYLEYDNDKKIYTTDKTGDADKIISKAETEGYKRITVRYPLDTNKADSCGTQYVYVYFEDTSGKGGASSARIYKICYDNIAPVLATETDSEYSISENVCQSNGWYTLKSKVSEENTSDGTKQSGFERVAFYFTRGEEIFDPMISKRKDGSPADGNRVPISGLEFSDGLYWKKQTVTRNTSNLNSITITEDSNIHVGGLVKLGGTIYTITAKSGTEITINGQPKVEEENAFFAIANVVDNSVQESESGAKSKTEGYGFGYCTPANDDGDKMIESVVVTGTDWIWNASIYSKNIADGEIKIHYVAFDKAGNYSVAGETGQLPVVNGRVCNNSPRIANLYAGTDLNATNTVTEDELTARYNSTSLTWNQDYNTGSALTEVVLGEETNAAITAKGMTVIRPEILGGNGDIYYSYSITNSAGSEITSGSNSNPFITGDSVDSVADSRNGSDTSERHNDITIQVGDFAELGISDCEKTAPHKFEFIFWDSTEGYDTAEKRFAAGRTDTAKAVVYMAVSMADTEEPKITREDLYWKSAGSGNNSIEWSGNTPLGHIELSDDWKNASGYNSAETSGEYDGDAKVSGKIILRGSVEDNKMLRYIYLKIPRMTDAFKEAGMESGTADLTDAYRAATYDGGGKWSETDKLAENGIKFTVTDKGTDSDGHKADWEFVWDTSYIKDVAASDVTIDVYASDQIMESAVDNTAGTYVSLNGTTKYKEPVSTEKNITKTAGKYPETLQVDVVPYITALETSLSAKGAAYARTAKGHWPVHFYKNSESSAGSMALGDYETVKVNGFNFYKIEDTVKTRVDAVEKTIGEGKDITTSVALELEFGADGGKMKTLNNINNNDSKGEYAGKNSETGNYSVGRNYYNMQPNNKNNNLLTDDVYIDVWQLNNKAAVTDIQKIETPTMKINPSNGMIGFSFRYGMANKNFAMPNGSNNSYKYWQKGNDIWNSVTFAYSSDGVTYGTAAGGESGDNYCDWFSFYNSAWGDGGAAMTGTNKRRIEITGQVGGKTMSGTKETGYTNAPDGDKTVFPNEKTKHNSPCFATAGTSVYLAYYDSFNKELRFKTGSSNDFGDFTDLYTIYEKMSGNYNTYKYKYEKVNIVAQENSPTAKPGEYVSIAASKEKGDNDNALVIVWYDSSANKMWYCYNKTPSTSRAGTINRQNGEDGWSVPRALFNEKGKRVTGEYCNVAMDGERVHIAAYDSSSGTVWYAYIPNYAEPENAVVSRVDAGQVGENMTLDVAGNKPYIGYYSTATGLPKVARYDGEAALVGNGSVGNYYTGNWEISFVPTDSKPEQDNINIGVWKNADNTLKNSTKNDDKNYSQDGMGVLYGNGSDNPVLGYRYTDGSKGYVEAAQRVGE